MADKTQALARLAANLTESGADVRISNVVKPTADSDAANKAYVDAASSGGGGYLGKVGYGLDTDDGNLNVDTDLIADTDWVKAYHILNTGSGQLVSGNGLEYVSGTFNANSTANHTLEVDTDVIADTEWVNAQGFLKSIDTDSILRNIDTEYIVAGTNVTVTNNDGGGVTIAATGETVDTDSILRKIDTEYIVSGDNVTVTNNTDGGVTIASTGGSVDTDSILSQIDTEYIVAGANITVTNNATGGVTVTSSAGGVGDPYVVIDQTGTVPTEDGLNAIAIGAEAQADSDYTVSMGYRAGGVSGATMGWRSIAVGYESHADGTNSVAVGPGASATGMNSVSIGRFGTATDSESISIGRANATGINAVAISQEASATAEDSIAIGNGTSASFENSIAIGNEAAGEGIDGISIGNFSRAETFGIGIGRSSQARGDRSTAIGYRVETSDGHNNSVIIGSHDSLNGQTNTDTEGQIKLGGEANTAVSFPQGTADPTGMPDGSMYYNTSTDKLRLLANGSWVDLN